jgi:pyruvate formate lyase activating enzyme
MPPDNQPDLNRRLKALTAAAVLFTPTVDGRIECTACAHRCALRDGASGLCGVRYRRDGELRVPWGYVAARRIMPVERNTIYHVRPGSLGLTFGMLGCDLRCPWCSNWQLSQAVRDHVPNVAVQETTAASLVAEATAAGCRLVASAFNEPMITAEWAYQIFEEAHRHGLVTALVSDGNTTPEALAFLRPVTDVYRVDLKGTTSEHYRSVGGVAHAPLDALREARRLGYWVEAVTVIVPGVNDDVSELRRLASMLADIDPDLPWHLNGFVPRYRMNDRPATAAALLVLAAGHAYARGLRYVYVGNVADRVQELSHTRCPDCLTVVVRRRNFVTESVALNNGTCPKCGVPIPGLWG